MEKIHLSNKQKKYYDYFLKELNLICLSLNENTKMNFKITKIQNKVQQFLIDIFISFCYGKRAEINSEPVFTFDINQIKTQEEMNYYKFRNEINVTLIYCYCKYGFSFEIIIPIIKQSIINSKYLDEFGIYYNKILYFLKKKYYWDDYTYLINYFTYFNPKDFPDLILIIKHAILFNENDYFYFFDEKIIKYIYRKLYCNSLEFFLFIFKFYLNKNILIQIKNIFFVKLKVFQYNKIKGKELLNYFDKKRKQLNEKEKTFNLLFNKFNTKINKFQNKITVIKKENQIKINKKLKTIQNEINSIQKIKNELFSIISLNKNISELKSNTI